MKRQKYINCLYIFCMLCLPLAAQQPEGISRRAAEELYEEEPLKQSVFRFDKTDAFFPKLEETDAPYTLTYHYVNLSDKAITIDKVTVSCGCMEARYSRQPIPAGGKGSIQIAFNPYDYSGKVYRQAFVYTSLSSKRPTARLTLSGEVAPSKDSWRGYPHHLGTLRTKQKTVNFKITNRKDKIAEVIACGNGGNQPFNLSASELPPYLKFYTQPSVIKPGEEADLIFQLDVSLFPKETKSVISVPIVLNGLEDSIGTSNRTITAVIQFD